MTNVVFECMADDSCSVTDDSSTQFESPVDCRCTVMADLTKLTQSLPDDQIAPCADRTAAVEAQRPCEPLL